MYLQEIDLMNENVKRVTIVTYCTPILALFGHLLLSPSFPLEGGMSLMLRLYSPTFLIFNERRRAVSYFEIEKDNQRP